MNNKGPSNFIIRWLSITGFEWNRPLTIGQGAGDGKLKG